MKEQIDNLGKVAVTIEEGYWDIKKSYDKLTIVERAGTGTTFISRKPVPVGTSILNRKYWIKFSKWSDIPYEITQKFGDSDELAISQKTLTNKFSEIETEIQESDEALDQRLRVVEVHERIMVNGGELEVATAEDLENPQTPRQEAAVPTVRAILNASDDEPQLNSTKRFINSNNLAKMYGYYLDNPEFIYVLTDNEYRIILGVKTDGDVVFSVKVPSQIKEYINSRINEILGVGDITEKIDTINEMIAFFDKISNDTTLKELLDVSAKAITEEKKRAEAAEQHLDDIKVNKEEVNIALNTKVDKEENKSLIDFEYASTKSSTDNPKFFEVITDSEGKLLEGIRSDGTKIIYEDVNVVGSTNILGNLEVVGVTYKVVKNSEYLAAWIDEENKVIFGFKTDGKAYVGNVDFLSDIKNNQKAIYEIKNILSNISATIESLDIDVLLSTTSIDNPEFIEIKIDSEGKLLAGRIKNGEAFEKVGLNTPKLSIDGNVIKNIEDIVGRSEITTDSEGKIISYRDSKGVKHESAGIEAPNIPDIHTIEEIVNKAKRSIYNYDQECNIYSAARYSQYSGEGDFQATLITDTHGNNTCIERAIDITNHIKSIKCFIHLGDIIGWTPFDEKVNHYDTKDGGFYMLINNIFPETCDKPWFIVPGNHDVGVTPYISFTRTDEEVYNDLIKPMIDNGILREGEYNTEGDYADKCYYFHDFHNNKIRIIVLYEYGWKQEVAENQYWEPVPYNSNVGQIKQATTYTYDENNPIILNCHNFKEFSFRLKKTVTTIGASTNILSDTMPRFKCVKGYQIFTKKQLEWLANTLISTPDGYGVVILSHQALMENVNAPNYKFSCNSNTAFDGYNPRGNGKSYDQLTDNLVISKIVDAWKNKSTLTEKVAAIPGYSLDEIGDPTYLNVLEDNGYKYMYNLSLDFSARTNNNAYFSCFINGHEHIDMIEQSKTFPYQLSIIPTCGNPPFRNGKDIASVTDIDSKAYDCLTIFTEKDKERIVLCKYGNMRTTGGEERDFEIINPYNI